MITKRTVLAGLLVTFIVTGCLMVPRPGGGVSLVPILPPILPSVVVLGAEPYYAQGGYYYYYQNNGWYYSRSRGGPWVDLPRDHYPKEVRVKHDDDDRGGGRNREHDGR
jgi:hypothetical protein